jgi:SAM-dependent methyltransferase
MPDPTERFSTRVKDYACYRPSYPPEVMALLRAECGLKPGALVADIGSGTGLFSQVLAHQGCRVMAVEPNTAMREAAEKAFGANALIRSVNARAEATTLAADSVDLVTAAQAFHWFEAGAARAEFQRILKSGGYVALIWNERDTTRTPFLRVYESLLQRYATDYARVDHRNVTASIGTFFGDGMWKAAQFPNQQLLDWEGVLGRLHSSSYAPQEGSPEYDEMIAKLESLFRGCQSSGVVQFLYETKVFYGVLG